MRCSWKYLFWVIGMTCFLLLCGCQAAKEPVVLEGSNEPVFPTVDQDNYGETIWLHTRVDRTVARPGEPFLAEIAFAARKPVGYRIEVRAESEDLLMELPEPFIMDGVQYSISDVEAPPRFEGQRNNHEAYPQRFQITLAPNGTKEHYQGSVMIVIAHLLEDGSGNGGADQKIYYCGTNERLCFSLESAEDAAMKYENTR